MRIFRLDLTLKTVLFVHGFTDSEDRSALTLIRKEILRGMSQWGIAFRLGLVFDSSIYMSTSDLILHDTFKQARIKLNRVNPIFPPADIMNYGAPPPTCGTFTVKSMKKAPSKLSKR